MKEIDIQAILSILQRIESGLESIHNIPMGSYLSVRDAAKLLRCSSSKVRDLIRTGKLKCHRLEPSEKSKILIKREEIERLFQ